MAPFSRKTTPDPDASNEESGEEQSGDSTETSAEFDEQTGGDGDDGDNSTSELLLLNFRFFYIDGFKPFSIQGSGDTKTLANTALTRKYK